MLMSKNTIPRVNKYAKKWRDLDLQLDSYPELKDQISNMNLQFAASRFSDTVTCYDFISSWDRALHISSPEVEKWLKALEGEDMSRRDTNADGNDVKVLALHKDSSYSNIRNLFLVSVSTDPVSMHLHAEPAAVYASHLMTPRPMGKISVGSGTFSITAKELRSTNLTPKELPFGPEHFIRDPEKGTVMIVSDEHRTQWMTIRENTKRY